MKKILLKLMFGVMLLSLLPIQVAQACSGFIVGKGLTADGSTLYGRTEDYPYPPDGGKHNQNYVVLCQLQLIKKAIRSKMSQMDLLIHIWPMR